MKLNLSALSDAEVIELARRRLPGSPFRGGDGRRYVRTPEGSRKYGLPIGALITADAIKRAAKRFPSVNVPEDKDRPGASAPKTARAKKTSQQIKEAIKKSPDLDPKRAKFSKLDGDQKTLVGTHSHNLPSGSQVYRVKGDKSVAIARTPDYSLYILTPKGRALDIRDRDTENELNERLDDIDANDPDFDVEQLGVDHDAPDSVDDGGDSGRTDGPNVDAELEDIASRLDAMADDDSDEGAAQQYRDLAQQLRDQKAAPRRAVQPKRAQEGESEDQGAAPRRGEEEAPDSARPRRAADGTSGEGDDAEPRRAVEKRPTPERKPKPPRRKASPRRDQDTSGRSPEELEDKELDDVLSDLTAAQSVVPENKELNDRVSALTAEKERRSSALPDQDGGNTPESSQTDRASETEKPAKDDNKIPEQPAQLDANPMGGKKLKRNELRQQGIEPGKGAFQRSVSDRNEIVDARAGDKFILRNQYNDTVWGMEDDGRFHLITDDGADIDLSPGEFADLMEPHPLYGKADLYAFSGNKDNKNRRPDPRPGDIAPAQWVDSAPEKSQAKDGTGILGEKNSDGTYHTALGDLAPDFFHPSDVENDDAVVVRNGPDPDGKPAGATVRITSKRELSEVSSGDALVVGDGEMSIERKRDGSFVADVDGLKIDLTPEHAEHFVENGDNEAWHVPNQDLVGEPSKQDWAEGDVLERLDDLGVQEPGTQIELRHQDDPSKATTYTVMPDGELLDKKTKTTVPESVLKQSIATGRVRVSKKDTAVPNLPQKDINTVGDYVDGDKIVDYNHLRKMQPGQQVTLTIPAKDNGGKSITVVLTRTDDTKDNAGWMFLVGKRGAGYNAFGENNASIFQAISDGRLYFGDITRLPGDPIPEVMDGDWNTERDIELFEGGPQVSEKDLRDFINAQIYSRAMQGSYYNVDLLPADSPFRSQDLRKKLSEEAIKKYSTVDEFGNPIPARHKPAMIRWASEKLGLEYGDPGAALIPDDLELVDFHRKVVIGRFIQSGNKADAEALRMGPEQMEVSVADIKIAYAVVANMLTSNQEQEMAELLGLKKKDLTPDRILKRVMAMRGSPLQDMNVSLAIASYYGMRRWKKDENGNWRIQSNVAAGRQYDKTRNKKLLLQMLREQMEGRPPGYYGIPEIEEYHWVTDAGKDNGWYRNVPTIQRPAINADNDPDGPGPLFRPDGTLSPTSVPDTSARLRDFENEGGPVLPDTDLASLRAQRRTTPDSPNFSDPDARQPEGSETPDWERALLAPSDRQQLVRPDEADRDLVAQALPGEEFDIVDGDGRALRVVVGPDRNLYGPDGVRMGRLDPEGIDEIVNGEQQEWFRKVRPSEYLYGGPAANDTGAVRVDAQDILNAGDGEKFVFVNKFGNRFDLTINGDEIDYVDVDLDHRGQWRKDAVRDLQNHGHFERRVDAPEGSVDSPETPESDAASWGDFPKDFQVGDVIHRRRLGQVNVREANDIRVVDGPDGPVLKNKNDVTLDAGRLQDERALWEYKHERPRADTPSVEDEEFIRDLGGAEDAWNQPIGAKLHIVYANGVREYGEFVDDPEKGKVFRVDGMRRANGSEVKGLATENFDHATFLNVEKAGGRFMARSQADAPDVLESPEAPPAPVEITDADGLKKLPEGARVRVTVSDGQVHMAVVRADPNGDLKIHYEDANGVLRLDGHFPETYFRFGWRFERLDAPEQPNAPDAEAPNWQRAGVDDLINLPAGARIRWTKGGDPVVLEVRDRPNGGKELVNDQGRYFMDFSEDDIRNELARGVVFDRDVNAQGGAPDAGAPAVENVWRGPGGNPISVGENITQRELSGAPVGTKLAYQLRNGRESFYIKKADGWHKENNDEWKDIEGWANARYRVVDIPGDQNPTARNPQAPGAVQEAVQRPDAPEAPEAPRWDAPEPAEDGWNFVMHEDLRPGDVVYMRDKAPVDGLDEVSGFAVEQREFRVVAGEGGVLFEDQEGRRYVPDNLLVQGGMFEFQHMPAPEDIREANVGAPVRELHAAPIPVNLQGMQRNQRVLAAQLRKLPDGAIVRHGKDRWGAKYRVEGDYLVSVDGGRRQYRIEDNVRKAWHFERFGTTEDLMANRDEAAQRAAQQLIHDADRKQRVARQQARVRKAEEAARLAEQRRIDNARVMFDPSSPMESRVSAAVEALQSATVHKTPSAEDRAPEALQAQFEHFDQGGKITDAPAQGLCNFIAVREDIFTVTSLSGDKGLSDIYSVVDNRDGSRFIAKVQEGRMAGIDRDALYNDVAVLQFLRFAGVQDVDAVPGFQPAARGRVGDVILMDDFAGKVGAPGQRVVRWGGDMVDFGPLVKDGPDPDAPARLVLVDYLIGNNADRHQGNVLGVAIPGNGGALALLDFGLGFGGLDNWSFREYFINCRAGMKYDIPRAMRKIYAADRASLREALDRELTKILGTDLEGYRERLRALGLSEAFIDAKIEYMVGRITRMRESGFLDEVVSVVEGNW